MKAPNEKSPDIDYHHPVFGLCFLPPVDGVELVGIETDDAPDIYQVIDQALDNGRLDIAQQLGKHL